MFTKYEYFDTHLKICRNKLHKSNPFKLIAYFLKKGKKIKVI